MPSRRFDDTQPPFEPLEPITDSKWDKLSESARADLLRKREAVMLSRHIQLMEGQIAIRDRIIEHGSAIDHVRERLDKVLGPLLEANTAATARTEAKVDASDLKLDLLVDRTAKPLAFWKDLEGTGSLIGRIGGFLKDCAWFGVPFAMLFGGYQAFVAWVKAGFPWPW